MSSPVTQQTGPVSGKGPIVRRPDTGCSVQLGAGLVPIHLEHGKKCKCIPVDTPEDLERLAGSVKDAIRMDILAFEKPSMAFAMLLMGGEVVYTSKAK